jgi:hypothetical protein
MPARKRSHLLFAVVVASTLLLFSSANSVHGECRGGPPLKPIHCVRGKVIDGSGGRISNAKVTILRGETEVLSVRSDADGTFSVEGLPPGNYEINVEADQFRKLRDFITVVRPSRKCNRVLQVVLGFGFECDTYIALTKAKDIR